jgi:hypothetical protein
MPIEQNFLKRRNGLVGIALLTYLLLPCDRSFGATISFGFDRDIFTELAGEAEIFLEETVMAWDAIAEELIGSATEVAAMEFAIANRSSNSQEQNNENKNNLSIGVLLDAFAQLKLPGDRERPGNSQSNVPILPQVGYADPNQGVYAFEATTAPRNKPNDSIIFNLNPINSSTSARPNAYRVANFGVASLNVARKSGTARGLLAAPEPSVKTSRTQTFDPTLARTPGNNLASVLDSLDTNLQLASFLSATSSFGLMDIDVGFVLFPETPIPTPLDLKDDFPKTSKLLRNDLQFTSPLQTKVQRTVRKQSQKQYQQQRSRAQRYQRLWQERQKRQQEAVRRKLARQQEKQEQQLRRQLERERRQQTAYHQKLQRQSQR